MLIGFEIPVMISGLQYCGQGQEGCTTRPVQPKMRAEAIVCQVCQRHTAVGREKTV